MKGLPTLIRLHNWELEEKRRQLADLESLAQRLNTAVATLDHEVAEEQELVNQDSSIAYSYPPYITVTKDRRESLFTSLDDVRRQIEDLHTEILDAYSALKKFEIAKDNRERSAYAEYNRKLQIMLDEIALSPYRR